MNSFKTSKAWAIFTLLIIILACNKEVNPPEADFQVSQVKTVIGSSINFYDKSNNTPTCWLWDFGDGETSNEQNPTHTYKNIAKYTVSLTVENEAGSDTKIWEDFIDIVNGHYRMLIFKWMLK